MNLVLLHPREIGESSRGIYQQRRIGTSFTIHALKAGRNMARRELNVTLPLTVSEAEAELLFAVKLYEVGRVSLGRAAHLPGSAIRWFQV